MVRVHLRWWNRALVLLIRSGSNWKVVYECQAVTARGGRFLEAPLLGNKQAANGGQLIILAAGDISVYEDCSSCFEAIGKQTFFLGKKRTISSFLFCESFVIYLLVYLLAWHPSLHTPYISLPNHCLLFAAHAHWLYISYIGSGGFWPSVRNI